MNDKLKKLLKEYADQYPSDVSPFKYSFVYSLEEIQVFLEERKGRRIIFDFNPESDDEGELIYVN
jgi:hypothetical protein